MCKPAPETPLPAFDCLATAALLRALGPLIWASQVAALLAADIRGGWVSLLGWVLVLYFAVRVQLDAGLFELLARDPAQSPVQLDQWLDRAGLRSSSATVRSVPLRCEGARRLARNLVGAWIAQMVALAAAAVRGNI